ncbi:hypothetical protein MRX96_047309 [Rhipicephalus microplus]
MKAFIAITLLSAASLAYGAAVKVDLSSTSGSTGSGFWTQLGWRTWWRIRQRTWPRRWTWKRWWTWKQCRWRPPSSFGLSGAGSVFGPGKRFVCSIKTGS